MTKPVKTPREIAKTIVDNFADLMLSKEEALKELEFMINQYLSVEYLTKDGICLVCGKEIKKEIKYVKAKV